MKHIIFTTCLLTLVSLNGLCQNSTVGIAVGGGSDLLWGNSITRQFSRPLPTGVLGVFTEIEMSEKWSTRFALSYDQHGSQTRINQLGNDSRTIYRLDYLSMPITARRYFANEGRKLRYFIGGGGYVAVVNQARNLVWLNGVQQEERRIEQEFTEDDYGVLLTLGCDRPLGAKLIGSFEVRNSIGLKNISTVPLINGSLRTYSTKLVLGLRLNRNNE